MKKLSNLVLIVTAVVIMFGCKNDKDAVVLTDIKVEPATLSMLVGGSEQLAVTAVPANVETSFSFHSENDAIATVSSTGKVEALGEGITNLIVTAPSGKVVKKVFTKVSLNIIPDDPDDPDTPTDDIISEIQPEDTSGERINVLAWIGVLHSAATTAHYQDMRDAGFTINLPNDVNGGVSFNTIMSTLDIAAEFGMKVLIWNHSLDGLNNENLRTITHHPGVGGYWLGDEPGATLFAGLGNQVREIQAIDNEHPCYINLYGIQASAEQLQASSYRAYVQQFIQEIPSIPFISFDNYPITLENNALNVEKYWYNNLEIIADEATKAGKPFWAFALSTAHYGHPIPSLNDLRLQVYSDLAYGAQGIQYFTYWTPTDAPGYHDGPVDAYTKQKTPTYYKVQEVNRDIIALSKVFLNAQVAWTAHTGTIPAGCVALDKTKLPNLIESLDITGGTGALVSMLEKGNDNFLVIVNHGINMSISVNVKGKKALKRIKKDGIAVNAEGIKTWNLTPGDMLIYFWKK
jgi:hypothetical protein